MRKSYASSAVDALYLSRKNLATVFSLRRFRLLGILVGVAYYINYMFLTGNIVYVPDVDVTRFASVPSIVFADDWMNKVWRLRAPGNWEPIGMIYPVNHMMILLPIPNMLVAVVISLLFGANFSLAFYRLTMNTTCSRGSASGIFAALPSFLTGFGCCVPTAALALGASFVAAFIAVGNFLLPASIFALGLALVWNASRMKHLGPNCGCSPNGENRE